MRGSKQKIWIGIQLLTIVPLMFSVMVVTEMTFAEPGGSYMSDAGEIVRCEAIASHSRSSSKYSCAMFGSKETNPDLYEFALAALCALGAVTGLSSRPGRGLRFSRISP